MLNIVRKGLIVYGLIVFLSACDEEKPEPLRLFFNVTHVSVYGGHDGSVSLEIREGSPPYSVLWDNGSTETFLTGLVAGIYYVTVTDAAEQTVYDSVIVKQPDQLQLQISHTDASQPGIPDGSVDLEISGGVTPYSIIWSTGDTTEDINNLLPGEYIVTVTDKNYATASDTVIILAGKLVVTDIDGNVYQTVQIGDQVWMKENLRVTQAPDGTPVQAYCYADDTTNARTYGRLYIWDAAMKGETIEMARGICPEGWHIPSDEEWKQLEMYLGMSQQEVDMVNVWRGSDQGTKLMVGGSSGYDALLSGRRSSQGTYMLIDEYEYIWTSTEYGESYAWRRCLRASSPDVGRWNTFPKNYAFSIRCIKD